NEDTPLEKIAELMEHRHFKRQPVVYGSKVAGIATRSNMMHTMVSLARTEPKTARDDATSRQNLLAKRWRTKLALASMINVVERKGVVELWGGSVDERQREALKGAAENIRGVKEMKAHLAWVEPASGILVEPRNGVTTH